MFIGYFVFICMNCFLYSLLILILFCLFEELLINKDINSLYVYYILSNSF